LTTRDDVSNIHIFDYVKRKCWVDGRLYWSIVLIAVSKKCCVCVVRVAERIEAVVEAAATTTREEESRVVENVPVVHLKMVHPPVPHNRIYHPFLN
jgi:hypothetical protein